MRPQDRTGSLGMRLFEFGVIKSALHGDFPRLADLVRKFHSDSKLKGTIILNAANEERCRSDRQTGHSIEQPTRMWKPPPNVHKEKQTQNFTGGRPPFASWFSHKEVSRGPQFGLSSRTISTMMLGGTEINRRPARDAD
jgi:hypothetical protein